MKINRILGILWLAFCCFREFNLIRAFLNTHPTIETLWFTRLFFLSFCLLDLGGIVASIFLYLGARWARWFIALLAVLVLFGSFGNIVTQKSIPMWAVAPSVFAIVSLVLLFLSRREPVHSGVETQRG